MILDAKKSGTIKAAAEVLREGKLIGLPTETVYGLAADAENDEAVAQIYWAKGRPADHPLIVHVADLDGGFSGASYFAAEVPIFALDLMRAFWPGALSLILPKKKNVANLAAGGQETIAIRCPSHEVCQQVLRQLRFSGEGEKLVWGVAAPSANRFGKVSPTLAWHVQAELGSELLVLDAGACHWGIESTIVDCTRSQPILLRPGMVTRNQIQQVVNLVAPEEKLVFNHQQAPRAPGMMASHYAPSKPLLVLTKEEIDEKLDKLLPGYRVAIYAQHVPKVFNLIKSDRRFFIWQEQAKTAMECAHDLFSVLRALDESDASEIWVEKPPSSNDWEGVADRLRRASVPNSPD